ncbi:bifunctional diguanylate cyclase/phosphodiesterase [Cellulomonas sp. URHD0024]|uniref:putative bifunctional diguanylate cyclase/phosphodiesterase n=1 Tax=Cellulomonas sp. URHD0024 TaxID=1302620 RepID=UPI0018CAB93D|nr:EAL domain-containing protein [Cellulomonas sp. URHD0024]
MQRTLPRPGPGSDAPRTDSALRSRLLVTMFVLAGTNVLLFGAELAGTASWGQRIGQTLNPVIAVLAVLLCRRAATDTGSEPAARRIWVLTSWGMTLMAAAIGARLAASMGPASLGHAANVLQAVGAILLSISVFRIPLGPRTRAERTALILDVATLLVGAAVILWHGLGGSRILLAGEDVRAVAPVFVAALVAVFLASRAAVGGSEVVPPRTVYLRAVSALVGGLGSAVSVVLLALRPELDAQVLLNPLASCTIALSACFQMADGADARMRGRRRRRYSLLPYLAVVAVGVLLVRTAVTHSPDLVVVALGAVLLTALVVVRQLIAFRENDALLSRLGDQEEQLRHEATHDALTGLANRALFAERLATAVGGITAGRRLSLVLMDLDGFKTVNDTLGHVVGDGLLVAVAARLHAGVRATDTVARLGGDEFAILVDGLGADALEPLLTRIAASLADPVRVHEHVLAARASFGVVDVRPGDDADALLRHADVAMYDAKERGEGGYRQYSPGMETRGAERSRLAEELRAAIDGCELVLHYQPVVTLPEGRITAVEALVRWQHPSRGLLAPGEFVPLAEQTGLVVPLGRWVLREATRQTAAWAREHGPDLLRGVAVNVSALQLQDPGFVDEVAAALRDSGLPGGCLTVEITESTAVGGGVMQDSLRGLRAMGVRVSLDDFGTGNSTLSLLVDCVVDEIKLDRRFAPAPGEGAIAGAVLQLARALGIEAVAEGVETLAQADDLGRLGYGLAQGFHFARPMTAQALGESMRATPARPVPA